MKVRRREWICDLRVSLQSSPPSCHPALLHWNSVRPSHHMTAASFTELPPDAGASTHYAMCCSDPPPPSSSAVGVLPESARTMDFFLNQTSTYCRLLYVKYWSALCRCRKSSLQINQNSDQLNVMLTILVFSTDIKQLNSSFSFGTKKPKEQVHKSPSDLKKLYTEQSLQWH